MAKGVEIGERLLFATTTTSSSVALAQPNAKCGTTRSSMTFYSKLFQLLSLNTASLIWLLTRSHIKSALDQSARRRNYQALSECQAIHVRDVYEDLASR